jgi:hypothetical protein
MKEISDQIDRISPGVGIIGIFFIWSILLYRNYLKPHTRMALLAWLGATLLSGVIFIQRLSIFERASRSNNFPLEEIIRLNHFPLKEISRSKPSPLEEVLWGVAGVFLALFLVPFVFKLYQKWICRELTEAEKLPNREGIRAWLKGGNLLCCLGISLCAWKGFNYNYWGILILSLLVLLAYPLINILVQNIPETTPELKETPREDLSREREKVLEMLASGKITAAESADLLNALGETVRQISGKPERFCRNKSSLRLSLTGGLIVLVAFFTPWFSVNLAEEMQRVSRQMDGILNEMARPSGLSMPVQFEIKRPSGLSMPAQSREFTQSLNSINICGGDIQYGLGWIALLLGLAASLLPFFAAGMQYQLLQKIILLTAGLGLIILLYLFTRNLRYVNVGIVLSLIGFGVIVTSSMRRQVLQ